MKPDLLRKLLKEDKTSGDKNLHLDHIEDAILGPDPAKAKEASKYLSGILDLFSGTAKDVKVTTKWDGAPALICGQHPVTKQFFVGTKSVFSSQPKYAVSEKDIEQKYPVGLADKLKKAFNQFKDAGIKGVVQGDILFTKDQLKKEVIDGKKYLTFRANTLTYAVPTDSDLAKTVQKSSLGAVFHTSYQGDTFQTLQPSYGVDTSNWKIDDGTWLQSSELEDYAGKITFSKDETESMRQAIKEIEKEAAEFQPLFKKNPEYVAKLKSYVNNQVRTSNDGLDLSPHNFSQHIIQKSEKTFDKLKTDRGRANREERINGITDGIGKNAETLEKMFALHDKISNIKLQLIKKINTTGELEYFVKTPTGYEVASPEGYVVSDRLTNGAVKLVDRLKFSKHNATLEHEWMADNTQFDQATIDAANGQVPTPEDPETAIVVAFGRFNPPTIGHEALIDKVTEMARKRGINHEIYLSHTQDKDKNPLPYDMKVALATKAFPKAHITKSDSRTVYDILNHQAMAGFKKIYFVAGSDRVPDFEKAFSGFRNNFNFDDLQVISAGVRDPDSQDALEGISASKMRQLARDGNVQEFSTGLPERIREYADSIIQAINDPQAPIPEIEPEVNEKGQVMAPDPNLPPPEPPQPEKLANTTPPERSVGSIPGIGFSDPKQAGDSLRKISGSSSVSPQRRAGIAKRMYSMATSFANKEMDPKKKRNFQAAAKVYADGLKQLQSLAAGYEVVLDGLCNLHECADPLQTLSERWKRRIAVHRRKETISNNPKPPTKAIVQFREHFGDQTLAIDDRSLRKVVQVLEILENSHNKELDPSKKQDLRESMEMCRKCVSEIKNVLYCEKFKDIDMPLDKYFTNWLKLIDENADSSNLVHAMNEVAPPDGPAKAFAEDAKNKAEFRKRYGKKWKSVFYETAWKMYEVSQPPKPQPMVEGYSYQQEGVAKFTVYKEGRHVAVFNDETSARKFVNRKNQQVLDLTHHTENLNLGDVSVREVGTDTLSKLYRQMTPGQ
jgi:nicotinic acid mononucleotide adenylyltransferase